MRTQLAVVACVVLAACQPGTPIASPGLSPGATTPELPDSPTPAPAAVPSVGPTPAATATPAEEVQAGELVTGGIYGEDLNPVRGAQLIIESSDERFSQTLEVPPGIFVLKDVPVGTELLLTATAPGYTRRTRRHTVRPRIMGVDEYPNRIDFGGLEEGMFYFISRQFEIVSTEPGPLAKEVDGAALRVQLQFTGAMDTDEQGRLEGLLRLRAVGDDGVPARAGTLWGEALRLRFTWNEQGDLLTLGVPVPLVARFSDAWAGVDFDPAARVERWPVDKSGRRLGYASVADTVDGGGASVRNRIAPFVRPQMPVPVPSVRPSPDALWGLTHATSLRFEIARDLSPLRVESVQPVAYEGTRPDTFFVRFNKPVYGFPEAGLAPAVRDATHFRFVLGSTNDSSSARRAFEDADPAKTGAAGERIEFRAENPRELIVRTRANAFSGYNRYKIYVGPGVPDIYGVELGENAQRFEGTL